MSTIYTLLSTDTISSTFDDINTNFSSLNSGKAEVTGKLSQFGSTTSVELASVISDETGSGGSLVFSNSPALTTPSIAAITVSGGVLTLPAGASDTLVGRVSTDTFSTGVKTFLNGIFGLRNVANTFTSFFSNTATAARTWTLPDANTTVPIISQQLTFSGPTAARTITLPDSNFTVARTDAANTFTGVQTMTSPSFITPVLGTPTSGNLTNCTVDGTDSVGFRNCPINSQSAAYTLVLTDAGKTIYHPSADTTARTWTIPANASVAYPNGTIIIFENDISAGALTISITTDTLVLVGAAGSTGSRTLAAGGRAVAQKVTSTRWRIDGNLLT